MRSVDWLTVGTARMALGCRDDTRLREGDDADRGTDATVTTVRAAVALPAVRRQGRGGHRSVRRLRRRVAAKSPMLRPAVRCHWPPRPRCAANASSARRRGMPRGHRSAMAGLWTGSSRATSSVPTSPRGGRWRRCGNGEACPVDLPQLLMPVPLHQRRLRRRGYNQALELARPLARQLAVPLRHDVLRRNRVTDAQTELDAVGRRRNVRGAFALPEDISLPAHVALLDDVMTTGATLAECARVLKRAGVDRVDVWALARAPAPRTRST